MSEQEESLLGNGKLTLASRFAAVYGAILATAAIGVLYYFGAHTLDRVERMQDDIHIIQTTLSANGVHAADQDRRLDRLDTRVFK